MPLSRSERTFIVVAVSSSSRGRVSSAGSKFAREKQERPFVVCYVGQQRTDEISRLRALAQASEQRHQHPLTRLKGSTGPRAATGICHR
jgi:hypothetical protein